MVVESALLVAAVFALLERQIASERMKILVGYVIRLEPYLGQPCSRCPCPPSFWQFAFVLVLPDLPCTRLVERATYECAHLATT